MSFRNSLTMAVAAATLAATLPAGPAQAARRHAKESAEERARIAYEMRYSGASDLTIEKRTGLRRVGTIATNTVSVPILSSGIPGAGEPSIYTVNTEVTVTSSFYYDSTNRKYNGYVDYSWKDDSTFADGTWWGGNVGGLDALAISFSRSVVQTNTPTSWSYWGTMRKTNPSIPDPGAEPGGVSVRPGVWNNSATAAGFRWQDLVWSSTCGGAEVPTCAKYNSTHGTLWYQFTKPSGCLQIFGAYGHTWAESTVTALTITLSGPELQIQPQDNGWQAASGAARIDC